MEVFEIDKPEKIKYYSTSSEIKEEIVSLRLDKKTLKRVAEVTFLKEWSRNHVIENAIEDYLNKELGVKVE